MILFLKGTPRYLSLVPLCLEELDLCKKLQGLSIGNAWLKLTTLNGEKIGAERGEIIFTHFGLSGPAALKLSRAAARHVCYFGAGYRCLSIDFLPKRSEEEITDFLSLIEKTPCKDKIFAKRFIRISVIFLFRRLQ